MLSARIALPALFSVSITLMAQTPVAPFRIGVVGLTHGHVAGFFHGALQRPDIQIVGIAEPDKALFDKYAERYHLPLNLYFHSLDEMLVRAQPPAVVVYTNTFGHRAVVEKCAARGVHVMMEKPLAISYRDALAIDKVARANKVHVIVNYETTWYSSNKAVYDLIHQGALGGIRKIVVHDGHQGPREIHVPPEFFAWLTDPKLDGAGALYDFGCYGADLATWLMNGAPPTSVTAVSEQIKPDTYPNVDDEADIILAYPKAIAILQASWNWPFNRKDMEVYGRTGYAKTILGNRIDVQRAGDREDHLSTADPLSPPYDDPLHYFAALVSGHIQENSSLSSLETNVTVSEILDAARQSAKSAKTVSLPLHD